MIGDLTRLTWLVMDTNAPNLQRLVYEIFGANTILFTGFILMIGTIVLTVAITRNTTKMGKIALPIAVGLTIMGLQTNYFFLVVCAVMWILAIWNNESQGVNIISN